MSKSWCWSCECGGAEGRVRGADAMEVALDIAHLIHDHPSHISHDMTVWKSGHKTIRRVLIPAREGR